MKRHLIKLMTIGAVATMMLASCNKNENGTADANVPENGFRATIEQPTGNNGSSRTHINPDWANDANTDVLWTADDQIKVANNGGAEGCDILTYQLTNGENTSSGTFYTGEAHDDFFTPNYVAAYPAEQVTDINGTTVTFNVPATQTYKANSFGEGTMPMVASSTTQSLAFKNVFGGICFPLTGNGVVDHIVLTGGTSDHLSGEFSVDSETGVPTYQSGGGNSVTLDCSAPTVTLDATTPTYFCIMVPPTTLASGFSIEVVDNAGGSKTLSTTANPNITRSNISKVNTNLWADNIPQGAISGLFSVSATQQVYFSQGNLQYQASTSTWRFAENQYDYVGNADNGTVYEGETKCNNALIAEDYTGWIDLFGWGTSGWNSGANEYMPYSTSGTSTDYYLGGVITNNLTGDYAKADWGVYHSSTTAGNGGIVSNGNGGAWRTLAKDEWDYLVNLRSANTVNGMPDARYAKATVNNVAGLILFPDSYIHPDGVTQPTNVNTANADFTVNNYDGDAWTSMEDAGCVFLPAAGYRNGTKVNTAGSTGHYWSTSTRTTASSFVHMLLITSSAVNSDSFSARFIGSSVRLVCPAE